MEKEMITAYINTNSAYFSALKQKEILLSFFGAENKEDVVFIEETDSFFHSKLQCKTLVVASLMCLGNDVEKVKTNFQLLNQNQTGFIAVQEKLSLLSEIEFQNYVKGFEQSLQLKAGFASKKIKSVLKEKKEKGLSVGRVRGSKNKMTACKKHKEYIFQALKNGESALKIAETIGVSPRTLFNYKKEIMNMNCFQNSGVEA